MTAMLHFSDDQLADPALIDVWFASLPHAEIAEALAGDERPLARVRRAQALMTSGQAGALEGLALISDVDVAPARGVRMLLLAKLGEWKRVLTERYRPRGHSPLELEELAHARYAESMAAAQLSEFATADGAREVALDLAELLGMPRRTLTLALECDRVEGLKGRPDPQRIARRLATATVPVASNQRAWAKRLEAENWLAVGRYDLAAQVLDGEDASESVQLRAFVDTLIGRRSDDTSPGGHYGALARAVTRLARGETDIAFCEPIRAEPQGAYSRLLLAGARLACARAFEAGEGRASTAWRAMDVLDDGGIPAVPDQRALWAALRLAGHVDGATHRDPLFLVQAFDEAARGLSAHRFVGGLLSVLCPHAAVLTSWLPGVPPDVGAVLDRVPMLGGRVMHYGGTKHRMNARRLGILEVLAEARPGEPDTEHDTAVTTTERATFEARLVKLGLPLRYVNLGWVWRALVTLEGAAQASPPLRAAWHEPLSWQVSARRVAALLSPEVRERLREEP